MNTEKMPVELYLLHTEFLDEEDVFRRKLQHVSQKRRERVLAYKVREDQKRSLAAGLLLEHILNQSRNQFIINDLKEVSTEKQQEYKQAVEKIIEGKPLQYITNKQYFMGLCFYVDENVLIPQPDTEILVEKTLELAKQMSKNKKLKILDIGTGSGAIAISLAKNLSNADITALDISEEALKVAKKNADLQEVNINFIKSNLFENLKETKFDIIVSNPPYIETNVIDTLEKEVQSEPWLALDGGEDGLIFYRQILEQAKKYLNNEGYLILEIGYNQGEALIELAKQKEWDIFNNKIIKDLSGNDRVAILSLK
mgnify:CR=1 FL=1